MPLAGLSLENYRAFVDRTEIVLRPLTLLFGYNSAGKSAVLRLLPILAASTGLDQLAPLALDSNAARGASFKDVLSRQSASPTLKLGLGWTGADDGDLQVDLEIRDLPERQIQTIERLRVGVPSRRSPLLEALWDAQPPDPQSNTRHYDFLMAGANVGSFDMTVNGIVPRSPVGQPFTETLNRASMLIRTLGERVHWLNSLRAVPQRSARFGPPPRRMASDGSNAGDFLAHDSLAGGELLRETSAWFERATGHRLSLRRYAVAGEEQYSVVITPIAANPSIEIPIMDTGEGMAQVLPVIVMGCLAKQGRLGPEALLAIEHPELHLHPAAHAELAAFFCGLVSAGGTPTTVIETHSENFLLRVQIAIARGEVSSENVVVHWVRGLDEGPSVVDTITFDQGARPQGAGWPPGVFREDTEQAKLLLKIRKERGLA